MAVAAITEPIEMMSVARSASRSVGLAQNALQCCSPPSKLPRMTETFG
jgi:hypothetical protein